jgi:FAD/FMN-containing dehydrogenase
LNLPRYFSIVCLAFRASSFYLHSMYSPFASVEKELRSQVSGDVWFDVEKRTEYSTATCMYKVMPVGVVAPKNIEDVQRVVRLCAENDIAVIPRGGGSGLVGQAVGFGLILDFTKYMNHVVGISEESAAVSVEAGCLLHDLSTVLHPFGTFYPIDPQSAKICTVGGSVATNAAGAHGLRYGSTKNQIKSLTAVLANGDAVVVNPNEDENHLTPEASTRFSHVKSVLMQHRQMIDLHKPSVEKYSSGYNIFESLRGVQLDATRLLCGSEGTLAIVTEAMLNILPLPKAAIAAAAYFDSYENTAEATQIARSFSPTAIELLDKSYTDIGRGLSATSDRFIKRDFQTMLLIEFEGDDAETLRGQAESLRESLQRAGILRDWILLKTDAERQSLWMVRDTVSEMINHLPSHEHKISTVEDGAVPLRNLPAYIAGLKKILDAHSIVFTVYGHAGMGHIHCSTFAEIATESGREKIERATQEVFDLIIKLDGVLSAEHGDGFVRTPFLEQAFGSEVYGIFKEIKQTLDPQNIFNPQKIIGRQDRAFLHDLKYS